MNSKKKSHRIYVFILTLFGKTIREVSFFAGYIRDNYNESIFLSKRREAGSESLRISKEILYKYNLLKNLNSKYNNNTLQLIFAKKIFIEVEYYIIRFLVFKSLIKDNQNEILWLKEPLFFDANQLNSYRHKINVSFYNNSHQSFIFLLKTVFNYLIKFHLLVFKNTKEFKSIIKNSFFNKNSVLTLQEDSFRNRKDLRNHPFWVNDTNKYNTYVLKSETKKSKSLYVTENESLSTPIVFFTRNIFKSIIKFKYDNKYLIDLKTERYKIKKTILLNLVNFKKSHHFLFTLYILKEAEFIATISLFLNIKLFVIKDVQSLTMDSLILVSNNFNIKTVGLQYSNMSMAVPLMLTTADYYFIFSKQYEQVFQTIDITPKHFFHFGYIYKDIRNIMLAKASFLREKYFKNNINFIIGFFDETIHFDKWGLISYQDIINDLHILLKYMLKYQNVGIILKPQFVKHTIMNVYKDDHVIREAIASGRLIEFYEGIHRNDIYPMQVGSVADFCISYKFGATAAIEVASLAKRVILIDNKGSKSPYDHLYTKDIVINTMDQAIIGIHEYRLKNINYNKFGDWSNLMNHFLSKNNLSLNDCLSEILNQKLIINS